ncbi:hypothetical protein TNCV_2307841 [Trichonephila clavipes]|nr:hypothetical protein TNCV_2307841 [Trichonephila clavipes]
MVPTDIQLRNPAPGIDSYSWRCPPVGLFNIHVLIRELYQLDPASLKICRVDELMHVNSDEAQSRDGNISRDGGTHKSSLLPDRVSKL